MARRDGPFIINIIEIPAGAVLGLVSKGLTADSENKKIEVSLGDGLAFDSGNRITVNTGRSLELVDGRLEIVPDHVIGDGLQVENHKVTVKLGDGLAFDADKNIKVTAREELAGAGLSYDNGKLNVNVGDGLKIVGNSVQADATANYEMMMSFSAISDVEFFVSDNQLQVKKTISRYDLERNTAGVVVGVAANFKREVWQTITLPVAGYGLLKVETFERESTPENPNFYQ